MRSKEKHKIHLVSLGCPKNTVDSERMLGLLGGNDYGLTTDPLCCAGDTDDLAFELFPHHAPPSDFRALMPVSEKVFSIMRGGQV